MHLTIVHGVQGSTHESEFVRFQFVLNSVGEKERKRELSQSSLGTAGRRDVRPFARSCARTPSVGVCGCDTLCTLAHSRAGTICMFAGGLLLLKSPRFTRTAPGCRRSSRRPSYCCRCCSHRSTAAYSGPAGPGTTAAPSGPRCLVTAATNKHHNSNADRFLTP